MTAVNPRESIEFPHAFIEVEVRAGYLLVIETGALTSLLDVQRYCQAMDRIIGRTKIVRAIIDARGEVGDPPEPVRDAMWQWLTEEGRGFDVVAFVLPTEMAVARVNMTALAKGARLRAFESVMDAQRWLLRGPRFGTRPTLPDVEKEPTRRAPARSTLCPKLGPGQYRSSDAPVDHIRRRKSNGGSEVA